jgi:sialic acid synthase SpsE/sugar phosphate isomerase/epimerase
MNPEAGHLLIAEIGLNHNGDFETAKKLVHEAALAGANAIKFQYRNLSRTYGDSSHEIGDEILRSEITLNFISVKEILELARQGKRENLKVGISFFDVLDIEDFGLLISEFDFFKVPSVELSNFELIMRLLDFKKMVYISTGAHNEEDLDEVLSLLPENGWLPLHCVSNYPVLDINSKLGYIEFMRTKWGRDVGYSSHDKEWETCLFAVASGVRVIERHITLDKNARGLDHSTSSTPEEFRKISSYLKHANAIMSGNGPRAANQGELINRQNLGKSLFARRRINENEVVDFEDFIYRHPSTGISRSRFERLKSQPLKQVLDVGHALTESHFIPHQDLGQESIITCNQLSISLPVRLHDYKAISEEFALENYELHLSYGEIEKLHEFKPLQSSHKFSIHLPDYLNSNELINPFSENERVRNESRIVFSKVSDFAEGLLNDNQKEVVLVSSLSIIDTNSKDFYLQCKELQDVFSSRGLTLCFQWLPPFAWYFGGSEPLHAFNRIEDLDLIVANQLNICLDTSHLLMGANFFNFSPELVLERLHNQIKHFHLADARGFDGEGYHLGEGEASHLDFLLGVISRPETKVVEVWQGHLNMYSGFHKALESIAVRF